MRYFLNTLKAALRENTKIIVIAKDIRMKSVVTLDGARNDLIKVNRKSSLNKIVGKKTESVVESYKSEKHVNPRGIDKFPSKCHCISGNFLNGPGQPVLCFFCIRSTFWLWDKYET